tara:strand:+ start:1404 stop:1793 length:390 start_codon:yes stop_codon:yes gene_type:complete
MSFIGVWNLVTNNNFNEFLNHVQIPWYQRSLASLLYVKVKIEKHSDIHYKKVVESYFHNSIENIILDDKYHTSDDGIKRLYTIENDIITVDIIGTIANWKEKIYNNDKNNLVIEYSFNNDSASQIFERE